MNKFLSTCAYKVFRVYSAQIRPCLVSGPYIKILVYGGRVLDLIILWGTSVLEFVWS
jgi:hypothetical protein